MTTTALAKADVFKNAVSHPSFRKQLQAVLKDGANSFMVSMLDLYSNESALQECNPEEVARECLKAALLKLPLAKSLGFAYVVPYKKKPTFTIGYKGLIQLAQRTGQYKCIHADAVYEGELLGFNKISGEIDLSGEKTSDRVIGYFSFVRMVSGFEKMLYMSREDMETYAKKYSPSFNSSYSPWKTEFDKMAIKTVLRRILSIYGALSVDTLAGNDLAKAMDIDDRGQTPYQEIQTEANNGEIMGFTNESENETRGNMKITEDGEIVTDEQDADF